MALTNAEKQVRQRGRVRHRLALAAAVEGFLADVEAEVADTRAGPELPGYSKADLLCAMLDGEVYAVDLLAPFLARIMNVDPDPWPVLTGDDLCAMTKGMGQARSREARDRLMVERIPRGPMEVDLRTKIKAHQNRAWLLGLDEGAGALAA